MICLEEITVIDAPIDRCFDLSRSVEVHLVANIHSGEQALAIGGITSGLPELSQQVTWRAKHFGVWQNLTSKFTAMQPPTYFQATMVKGIFRSMQADHYFRTLPSGATEMKDLFRVAAPLPVLGPLAGSRLPSPLHAGSSPRAQHRHQADRRVKRLATLSSSPPR